MNKKITITLLLLAGVGSSLLAQQGFGTNAPDASAVVEMKASNKGVLLPRVSLSGTNDQSTISQAADYLWVVHSPKVPTVPGQPIEGFYYWENPNWTRLLFSGDPLITNWNLNGNANIAGDAFLGTTNTYPLVFKTKASERMRIWNDGSVQMYNNYAYYSYNGNDGSEAIQNSYALRVIGGMLIPRMNDSQMGSIKSPALGLMVFNTEHKAVYVYRGQSLGFKPVYEP